MRNSPRSRGDRRHPRWILDRVVRADLGVWVIRPAPVLTKPTNDALARPLPSLARALGLPSVTLRASMTITLRMYVVRRGKTNDSPDSSPARVARCLAAELYACVAPAPDRAASRCARPSASLHE